MRFSTENVLRIERHGGKIAEYACAPLKATAPDAFLGIGWLYRASSLLGLAVTAGFVLGWAAAVMFWLVAALVLVAVALELFKPNKLKEWMSRCYWGKASGKYDSLELEKAQYELALKG